MANPEFYRLSEAYDKAFSDRDFDKECDFYRWCFDNCADVNMAKGQLAFFEIACGPANHSRVFARRGWKTAGLDLSEPMLEYAAYKDDLENLKTDYYCQNMVHFQTGQMYDLIVTPLESISHILTNDDMITHFNHIADHLNPGGIYIIESTHPRFFFPDEEANSWSVEDGNQRIELLFGTPDDEYDAVAQVWDVNTGFRIYEDEKLTEDVQTISKHRWYLYQEYLLFEKLCGRFSKSWYFGNYSIPPGKLDDSEDSDALVVIYRK